MSEEIALAGMLGLLVWVIIWDSLNGPHSKNVTPDDGKNARDKRPKKASIIARFPHIQQPPDCPQQAKHWYQARRQADFAFLATVFAALAVVGGFFAFREARIQADAAFQNTRAWLTIATDQRMVSLQWNNPNGPTITTHMVATNIGNSPAFLVQVFPNLSLGENVNQDATKKACASLDGAPWGNTVFMKEPIGGGAYSTSVSWADIEAYYVRWAKLNKLPVEKMKSIGLGPDYTLTICTSYNIVGDVYRHHSGRVYSVGTLVESPNGPVFVAIPKDKDMPAGTIALEPKFQGDYAD